jgi:glutathione synthase/RimK-type ligase-like ATP-grasp enzyme
MEELLKQRVVRLYNDRPNTLLAKRGVLNLIHWGVSGTDQIAGKVYNSSDSLRIASNKLSTFNKLKDVEGVRIPEYTTDRSVALDWLRKDGVAVVARTKLSGHSGDGIVLVSDKDAELCQAPIYVKYIKKQKEFRVHVAFGEVIDVQEKRQRSDYEGDTNFQVRNHQTGWVYCRENIQEPTDLRKMATVVVQTLGLDFGAVDLIYNEKRNEVYCLEVNTAPGLEGSTVDKYAEAFVKEIRK